MQIVAELDSTKTELATLKAQKAALDEYELFSVAPGRFVFCSKGGHPAHFACPNCRNTHGRINILQVESGYGDDGRQKRYQCTACSFDLFA